MNHKARFKGDVQVDGAIVGPDGAPIVSAGSSGAILPFQGSHSYAAGEGITQGGQTYTRNTAGISRATFDATEASAWTVLPRGTDAVTARLLGRSLGIYNRKISNLRRARAALAAARAGEKVMNIACVGDSITSGNGTDDWITKSYPARLNARIAKLDVLAGDGYIMPTALRDDRRIVPGTPGWTLGNGTVFSDTAGQIVEFTSDAAATVITVGYFRSLGSGTFDVAIDDVTVGTIDCNGATSYGEFQTYTGLADTPHTVRLTTVAPGSGIYVTEIGFLREFGIVASNFGQPTTLVNNNNYTAGMSASNPDLTIILLETNDSGGGDEFIPEFKAGITSIVNLARETGDAIICTTVRPETAAAALPHFDDALFELADTLDVPLIDFGDAFGSYANANAFGLMGDPIHPGPRGNDFMADLIYGAFFTGPGPIIMVSDPIPPDTSALAIYDANDLTALLATNAPVATWPEKTGTGMALAQAASGARPLYILDGGKAGVKMDGVDDFMQYLGGAPFVSGSCTIVLVTRQPSYFVDNSEMLTLFDQGSTDPGYLQTGGARLGLQNSGGIRDYRVGSVLSTIAGAWSTSLLISFHRFEDGVGNELFINDDTGDLVNYSGSISADSFRIGARVDDSLAAAGFVDIIYHEIQFIAGAMSPVDRASMKTAMETKWT